MSDDRSSPGNRRQSNDRRIADRRADERMPHDASVRLLTSTGTGQRVISGGLQDASAGGLRLHLTQPLQAGERLLLEVRHGSQVLLGVSVEVVWCEATADECWLAGCNLSRPLRPRQLKMLEELAARSEAASAVHPRLARFD